MEQILTRNNNKVDAVVASKRRHRRRRGGGPARAEPVGVPVSGQDGDVAALNRVARGEQTVTVWKDARELGKAAGTFAARLAGGTALADVKEAAPWTGGSRKLTIPSVFLKPLPVTKENLRPSSTPLGDQGAGVRRRRPGQGSARMQVAA
jgi:D-xylose transport system substrate-binding protein